MTPPNNNKRPHQNSSTSLPSRKKTKKQWRVQMKPSKSSDGPVYAKTQIEPGDAGIWATCDKGREGKATIELRDFFEEWAKKLYGVDCLKGDDGDGVADSSTANGGDEETKAGVEKEEFREGDEEEDDDNEDNEDNEDIEASVARELSDLRQGKNPSDGGVDGDGKRKDVFQPLFQAVRLKKSPCLLFFKTRAPVKPVEFVQAICRDAAAAAAAAAAAGNGSGKSEAGGHGSCHTPLRCRFVKRLTPVEKVGKATENGIEEVGRDVLGKVFQPDTQDADGKGEGRGAKSLKFAIRPTIRNHNVLKRDDIIPQIASMVGPGHSVDLKGYDVLILVDIYQNTVGMSVVGDDFEKLKRFNLAEIHNPTTKKEDNHRDKSDQDHNEAL